MKSEGAGNESCPPLFVVGALARWDKMDAMIHTLNPSIAGGNVREGAAIAARHGFQGIELPLGDAHAMALKEGVQAVADIYAAHNLVTQVFDLGVEWRQGEDAFTSGMADL